VVVVNEAFVKRYLAGRDPLGAAVQVGGFDAPHRVIGVVADTRINSLTGEVRPRFYAMHEQPGFRYRAMNLVVRTSRSPSALSAALRAELGRLDPRLAASEIRTLEDVVAGAMAQPRFTMQLLSVFAALALALGGIGTYGLIAHAATQRRREMGIRLAVGARPKHVLALVLREGAGSIGAGLLLGGVAAVYATRWLSGLLYEVRPGDPVALGSALVTVVAAALLAAAGPAWRASRTDPTEALRDE
jgi:predicted lysophospholipase L1 biosynthesis ABC-type transport system permease subunit